MPAPRASKSIRRGTDPQQRPASLTASNHEIFAAFRQDGCPLCRTEAVSEGRYIASFLREGWRVRSARAHFNRAGGFCRRHGWELYGAAHEELTGAGVAAVYGQLPKRDLTALDELLAEARGRRWSRTVRDYVRRESRCPACSAMERIRASHASFLVELLGDELGQDTYGASDGLCFNHLRDSVLSALDRRGAEGVARYLLEDWRLRLDSLGHQLREYDRKRSYDNPEPTAAEQCAWTEVIRRYVGQGGVEYGFPERLPASGAGGR